jgi:hypothetical protein
MVLQSYILMAKRKGGGGERSYSQKLAEQRGEGMPGMGGCCLYYVVRKASMIPCHLGREQMEVMMTCPATHPVGPCEPELIYTKRLTGTKG